MELKQTVSVFLHWWGEGLYRGLPGFLRKWFYASMPHLVLQLQDTALAQVVWVEDGKARPLGRLPLGEGEPAEEVLAALPKLAKGKPYAVEVCLPPKQALHLVHTFPEAVKNNLRQVVGYQLDRLTPFTAENACFDASIKAHDKQRKEITADIYLMPRRWVEQLGLQLQRRGIQAIQHLTIADAPASLNLLGGNPQQQTQRWSLLPLYLFLAALVLSLLLPLAYQYRRVGQIEAALAEVRRTASEQLAVRDQLLEAGEVLQFVMQKRKESPMALDTVERLSALLPQNTWLERLELNGNRLELRGESGAALALIDALEGSPEFSAVRFKAPVSRNKDTGHDRFHLEANVEVAHAQ